MSWQPPQRPGGPGPAPGGQQPQGGGHPQGAAPGQAQSQLGQPADLSLYQLLQVDRDSHVTIIRYAYRFLAAMYHPDNGETGDAEKFRIITDAWKTLSDESRRQAYDMTLNMKDQAKGQAQHKPQAPINEFGKQSMPVLPKTGVSYNEVEMRLAILQLMLQARKKKPRDGGVSIGMMMDILNVGLTEAEFALWYLRERGFIETGERVFMITGIGLDYLVDNLGKVQALDGGNSAEKKVDAALAAKEGPKGPGHAGLPARL
ncbi:MAG: J domain-containing protein [Candidatus Obscuribacterales bacterium]|nr:J domain-containing protein [Candidatus Obscuribacterales bacterium]